MAPAGPVHHEVRLPLIEKLKTLGWKQEQFQWSPEWRVPKSLHEATKREEGKSFAGFPVDLAIFESAEHRGQWEYIKVIVETKAPTMQAGISQLETYLRLEPRAMMGLWTNGTRVVAVNRLPTGKFQVRKDAALPRPEDDLILPGEKPLTWKDLRTATARELRSILERLLNHVVARDSKSTRRDDQLNQLCNLVLIKLESDRKAKIYPAQPVVFQVWKDENFTAAKIIEQYKSIKQTHGDVFASPLDQELKLDESTLHRACYELAPVKLLDVGIDAVSFALQTFRSENLKSEDGQYFTPAPVIRSAVQLLDITYDDKIIDPACGTGGFLTECFRQLKENNPDLGDEEARWWAQHKLYGVDKDPINIKLTKAMMMVLGNGAAHTYAGDSLRRHLWAAKYPALVPALTDKSFTCIVTNPPFGENLTLSANEARDAGLTICQKPVKQEDDSYTFDSSKYVEREIGLAFLELCWRLLDAGGRMAIVLPETYFFSKSYLWLYDWMKPRLALRGIFNVPMEAFQGFCRAKTNLYVFEKV
jgi:type I restriction enzyme M protein